MRENRSAGNKTKLDHRFFFITTDVTLSRRRVYIDTCAFASDHFRDKSTASSSSSSRCLQSYFLPLFFFLFFFRTREKTRLGKISCIYFTRQRRNGVSLYIIQDVVSQKLETTSQVFPKCLTFDVSDSSFLLPIHFLIPSSTFPFLA